MRQTINEVNLNNFFECIDNIFKNNRFQKNIMELDYSFNQGGISKKIISFGVVFYINSLKRFMEMEIISHDKLADYNQSINYLSEYFKKLKNIYSNGAENEEKDSFNKFKASIDKSKINFEKIINNYELIFSELKNAPFSGVNKKNFVELENILDIFIKDYLAF